MKSTFLTSALRGVPVPHHKNTQDAETTPLLAPARVIIPLAQHIGRPAICCVTAGARVFVGARIGAADGNISADIHASVSGTVLKVTEIALPSGIASPAVMIESDGAFTPDPSIKPPAVNNQEELAAAVARSGLVGLGGAGFPTHVKLQAAVDTLIINAAECEPYITSDYREMLEHPDDILEGIARIRDLLGIQRVIIGIETNKPAAIALLRVRAEGTGILIAPLKAVYPQGAERIMIAGLTGRTVPADGLPADVGVLVVNVSTVACIARYLRTGMPLVTRRVTVDGDVVARPGNLLVPIGTPVSALLAACGGCTAPPARLLMGGPMTGIALPAENYPILKTTNSLLAFSDGVLAHPDDYPCIRCGRCNDHCPVQLSPAEIQVTQGAGDVQGCAGMKALTCIECGCCSYICPAKRPVTQIMRQAKADIRKAGENQNG